MTVKFKLGSLPLRNDGFSGTLTQAGAKGTEQIAIVIVGGSSHPGSFEWK